MNCNKLISLEILCVNRVGPAGSTAFIDLADAMVVILAGEEVIVWN